MNKNLGILIFIVICCLNLTADLNDGLIAHYPFNGNANDESGNENNGIVNGATLTTDRFGNENYAYSFDGINDYIQLPYGSGLNPFLEPITISLWVKANSILENEIFFSSRSQPDDRLYLCKKDGFWDIGIQNSSWETGVTPVEAEWTHIVLIMEFDEAKLYINTDYSFSKTYNSYILGNNFTIGAQLWDDIFFQGKLDETRFYNRALTESEIQELYFEANFTTSKTIVYVGEQIQFTDTSTGNPTSWEWDFENDGIYDSFIQYPTHTYNIEGTYSVKLKIGNGVLVDSLVKENLIAVSYCPPDTVQNVQLVIDYPNANISWDAVTTNENGATIEVDGYIVLFSENDEDYFYLYSTTETNYSHIRVVEHRTQMFYNVVAFKNYNREQIEYLERLNNSREKIKWSEVKRNLEARK